MSHLPATKSAAPRLLHRTVHHGVLLATGWLDLIIARVLLVLEGDAGDVGCRDGLKTASLRIRLLVEA